MDNKEFGRLVELWKKAKLEQDKGAAALKTKDCLFFTEFEGYAKNGCEALTEFQRQHIESCAYCQKMIASFAQAMGEEKHPIPLYVYEQLKALFRFTPALAPVLAAIIIFVALSNQQPELKNYSLEFSQPTMVTRGLRITREIPASGKKFKIHLAASHNGYAYLFAIEKDKAALLLQEKIMEKLENVLPREGWLEGKGDLILLLTKNPLKNISSAEEIIMKNYDKGKAQLLESLKEGLKSKDLNLYNIETL